MLKILLLIIITFASLTGVSSIHKVRHKHNLLGFRDNHINEVREAFYAYRNVIHKDRLREYPEVNIGDDYDDDVIYNNLHLSDEPSGKEIATTNSPKGSTSEFFLRNKRVFTTKKTTTTTRKVIDNYDEEYEDDDDNSNRRFNDDAQVLIKRYSSGDQNQMNEGESLTDFKMKTLGTRQGVEASFQQILDKQQRDNPNNRQRDVILNMRRLEIDGKCRWPNKKIIEMPSLPSKRYTPSKYIIYQCSDDTACCASRDKTCVAKKTEEVDLWFHVSGYVGQYSYEVLTVKNHTECECVYKNQARINHPPYAWPLPTSTKAPMCKCPSHFVAEVDSDGECGCVCKDGLSGVECRQRYEGKEGFLLTDRICIVNGVCVQPHCLYGTYSKDSGRCPDRNDKINRGFQGTRTTRSSW